MGREGPPSPSENDLEKGPSTKQLEWPKDDSAKDDDASDEDDDDY